MMFFSKFKKISAGALVSLFLLCQFGGANVYAADIKTSKSKLYVYENSSGGKSRDVVVLKKPSGLAEGSCALFVSAKIKYNKQRFGVAEIKSKPKKGCNPDARQCKVTVESKHGPVGFLHYWVTANWKIRRGC